ncbi:hypothetical protein EN859_029450 [Mesorhizobium sp. M00.F.Ca.ET.216.01.1.1]|nr:hypothetical protein EN859_029450 [Mesorhizobium sp. M00.F.Ca.ET.216.01.1.1]TIS58286.1 MAG: hypothetical protein E5W91_10010 [Mesorhizobium sp.]TIS92805.1 MAG: hypothetical protein E5W89_00310 [Mesorhizobium sp.]TJW15038.1 MAG: hypothetical protein E5W82_10010 [Mesorhizobium sp.]TJW41111.1 MAG: hypothetical protein E5W83_26745 [Mesorhizobium sp.]
MTPNANPTTRRVFERTITRAPAARDPEIGIDFRKGSCAESKCYSVLCASKRTRGAVGTSTS